MALVEEAVEVRAEAPHRAFERQAEDGRDPANAGHADSLEASQLKVGDGRPPKAGPFREVDLPPAAAQSQRP